MSESNIHQFVPFKKVGTDISTKVANDAIKADRLKPTINVETLAATKTLVTIDYLVQWLDPGGADRDVTLPAEASSTNLMFIILNTSDGTGEDLVVKNDAAATIATLGPGMSGIFSCDGTNWKWEDEVGIYYDKIAGGVVSPGYHTVGQTALNTTYPLYVNGNSYLNGYLTTPNATIISGLLIGTFDGRTIRSSANSINVSLDIDITSGTATHQSRLRIDATDIVVAQATGDGSGGITNKAIGFYGHTPGTQPAAIADPAESTAGNNAAIDAILAALRSTGLIAT